MAIFVKFIEDRFRKDFFLNGSKCANKSWNKIIFETKIPRGSLDCYKNGSVTIPKRVFDSLSTYLSIEKVNYFSNKAHLINSEEWLSRGGKKAYILNREKFTEGRIKGLKSIERLGTRIKTFDFRNFKLYPEICEFIGAFIGDGFFNCYKNKIYQIEFSGDRRYDYNYYLKTIIPLIKKEIPGLNPHIIFPKNKNTLKIRFFSKELFCFLKQEFNFKPGVKTYTVVIPDRIISAGEEYIRKTIRGIFDTDGCIFLDKRKIYKKPYSRIVLQTVSKPLYDQLKEILSRKFSIRHGKNANRNIYYIEVYGFDNLKKWMSEIGFSNERHLNRLPQ